MQTGRVKCGAVEPAIFFANNGICVVRVLNDIFPEGRGFSHSSRVNKFFGRDLLNGS
jgi:hypothetical protein